MSTLLIIYPPLGMFCASTRACLARQRREHGLRVVVAGDLVTASPKDAIDDVIELPPSECVREAHEILSRWCGGHRVDAVFLQSEAALAVGSLLVRDLGLPGPSVEAVHACLNKYLCRTRLSQQGIPTPRFVLGENGVDTYKAASQFGYPLVLKAVASAHARLVTLVNSPADVEAAVAHIRAGLAQSQDIANLSSFATMAKLEIGCSPTRQFLIESFAEGYSLESDGLIAEGGPMTFGIIEQIPSKDPPFFIEGYVCPPYHAEVDLGELRDLSSQSLAAVGLSHAGFSIEMRATDNYACVIEVNGRLGRDDGFGEMFETRTGCLPILLALELVLGIRPETAFRELSVAVAYRCCYEDAIIEQLPDRSELCSLEDSGLTCGTVYDLGTRVYGPPHRNAHPHLAWVLATHPESSQAAYHLARHAVDRVGVSVRPI